MANYVQLCSTRGEHGNNPGLLMYGLGMGVGYTGMGVVSPNSPMGGPVLHPSNTIVTIFSLLMYM
jgi:hypothetical protein